MTKKKIITTAVLTALIAAGIGAAAAGTLKITAEIQPSFVINIDGDKKTFYDEDGNIVYPIVYEGTTYLPIRAIGNIMDKDVDWDAETQTVYLRIKPGKSKDNSKVKDTENKEKATQAPAATPESNPKEKKDKDTDKNKDKNNAGITAAKTLDEAKEIALKHAGVTASEVVYKHEILKSYKSMPVYKIEFYVGTAEYEYEIDGNTGEIIDYSYDTHKTVSPTTASEQIGEAKAKAIALEKVTGATDTNIVKCKLDTDDKKTVYEIEIIYENKEYDFEIDAYSGEILETDIDTIKY